MTWLGGEQVIPRPPGAYPGGRAPWAELPAEDRRGFKLERVVSALETYVSDLGDEKAASGAVVPEIFFEGTKAPSAVLVALFEEQGETRVVLTRRSKKLRFHQGEVSFPGGRCDVGETVEECALREALEETGLDPGAATIVGHLSPLTTMSSQSLVVPVAATLGSRPDLAENPAEVERVFDVALADLMREGTFREERWRFRMRSGDTSPPEQVPPYSPAGRPPVGDDGTFPVWFFELPGDTVWGATARILVEVLSAVTAQ